MIIRLLNLLNLETITAEVNKGGRAMRALIVIILSIGLVSCGPKTQMGKETSGEIGCIWEESEGPYYIGALGQKVKHGQWVIREYYQIKGEEKKLGKLKEEYYSHGELTKIVQWSSDGSKRVYN